MTEPTGTRAEWLRFRTALILAWPFLQVALLGEWANQWHNQIIDWGERATRYGR